MNIIDIYLGTEVFLPTLVYWLMKHALKQIELNYQESIKKQEEIKTCRYMLNNYYSVN